jgi:catechol 2,3-dioxygenase-like lactoylglutathione lyase family enzyme
MKTGPFLAAAVAACTCIAVAARAQELPPPGFHHLMLNSVNPDAAIDYYVKRFAGTTRTSWEGIPAIRTPNNVLVLFNKVAAPPDADPQSTAFWHFGWNATDERAKVAALQAIPATQFAPLYTTDEAGSVIISSDSWPGAGGTLGRTKAQIAQARADNVQPAGGAGFAYLSGPDGALIEVAGNQSQERFNHIHMWEDQPFCAQLWYHEHLNSVVPAARPLTHTDADCKVARTPDPSWPSLELEGMYRAPTAGVVFGDVAMNWYMDQTDKPLAGTQGHLMDHVGLSVADLDAWVAKLRKENVTFLRQPFRIGNTRAVMIEGPSHEALELVEVK